MLAGAVVAERKKENEEIRLIACIPCPNQDKYFSPSEKEEYERLLSCADETVLVSEKYTPWCMAKRNDYMVERADALIAYCNRAEGGSAYTLKKFLKKGGMVFRV